ncbi:MAG: hypothetical protein KDJ90_06000 [Nitratireductor sp.]|nr:hypothetical protein [Nitratireductor sp.]
MFDVNPQGHRYHLNELDRQIGAPLKSSPDRRRFSRGEYSFAGAAISCLIVFAITGLTLI